MWRCRGYRSRGREKDRGKLSPTVIVRLEIFLYSFDFADVIVQPRQADTVIFHEDTLPLVWAELLLADIW